LRAFGDVVYGDAPLEVDNDAWPWLIVSNHEGRPLHGDQYIALTLTSTPWMDGFPDIPAESWLHTVTPDESRVVPSGVQSTGHEDIGFWQGRPDGDLVDQVVPRVSKNSTSGSAPRSGGRNSDSGMFDPTTPASVQR